MPSSKIQLGLLALLPAALAAPTSTTAAIQEAESSGTVDSWAFEFGTPVSKAGPAESSDERPFFPFGVGFPGSPFRPGPPGLPFPGPFFPDEEGKMASETYEEDDIPSEMPAGWSKSSGDSATSIIEREVSAIGFQDASSGPLPEDFIVTPGPGMPTLESLGLTSADLLNKNFLEKHFPLTAAAQAVQPGSDITPRDDTNVLDERHSDGDKCRLVNEKYATGRGVIACKNYLQALNKQDCRVPGGKDEPRTFCTAISNRQTTWVEGLSMSGGVVSTKCNNLAAPISRIHFECSLCLATMFDCATKGADVVDNSTRMLITVHGSWKP